MAVSGAPPSHHRVSCRRRAATLALLAFAMLIVSLDQYIVAGSVPSPLQPGIPARAVPPVRSSPDPMR
jgi:hypothetical protein